MSDIRGILKSVFGYDSFRGQQEEIIEHTLSGNDSLVIMPTGGGKSLCYQVPAIAGDGLTVVVSPLIALMNDQVSALHQVGVEAAALHSHVTSDERSMIHHKIANGTLKLLYVSPEKLNSSSMIHYLQGQKVSLIAIDEAHCVSIWGNDFRPDYVQLSQLRDHFADIPIIALTATADDATRKDIVQQLRLDTPKEFLSSFERENITLHGLPGQKRMERILEILDEHDEEDCGIIYCLSRKGTETITRRLVEKGYDAESYHAGMDKLERARIQRDFQNDKCRIVCATIAFGMGIDKPNIRYVIHYNMPKNIEAYYQEVGRAGRDGAPSKAYMFYSWADHQQLRSFIDSSPSTNQEFIRVQYAKLERMWEYSSTSDCRTNGILAYFGEYKNTRCGHCDNCLQPPSRFDGTVLAQKALSAIIRLQRQVGIEDLIDVLRGSHRKEIIEKGYDKVKTFGAGRDTPKAAWLSYLTQLINQGLVAIDYKNGSKLYDTVLAKEVLYHDRKVRLVKWLPKQKAQQKVEKKIKPITSVANLDRELQSELKNWRSEMATEMNVPQYVILSNKSLDIIASLKPNSIQRLSQVYGMGKVKCEKYGDAILEMISKY